MRIPALLPFLFLAVPGSAMSADFYYLTPDVWGAAGTPAFAPYVGRTVEVQGTFRDSSGEADVTERWSGVVSDNGDKIVCLRSATAATEQEVMAQRGDIRNDATITGTIRDSETILGFFPTIWLEDGCSVQFTVPLLTEEVTAGAPLVTLNAAAFAQIRAAQQASPDAEKPPFQATRIWDGMIADGLVDDAELAFIGLTQISPNEIRVSDGTEEIVFRSHWVYPDDVVSYGPTYLLTSARENAASSALYPRLETFWAEGGEGMDFVAIFEETKRSIAHDVMTRGFLADKFQALLAISTVQTIYQPAMDIVGAAYRDLDPLGDADKRAARDLLHSVITLADSRRAEGSAPAPVYMYNWIDPDYVAP
ncbi:MAG: hypothetical protein RJB62_1603 [Pseudomonadota bacterium]|jgi:hypothetical protein